MSGLKKLNERGFMAIEKWARDWAGNERKGNRDELRLGLT